MSNYNIEYHLDAEEQGVASVGLYEDCGAWTHTCAIYSNSACTVYTYMCHLLYQYLYHT